MGLSHDFNTILCDLRQVSGIFTGSLLSSRNKTDSHDITEILLKVSFNTITLTLTHFIDVGEIVKWLETGTITWWG
jgi:hypothetical protein